MLERARCEKFRLELRRLKLLLAPVPTAAALQLKALEQQPQLRHAHLHHRLLALRPIERGALEALARHPKAAAVPVQTADAVVAPVAEHEEVPREDLCVVTHRCCYVAGSNMWRPTMTTRISPATALVAAT